VAVSARLVHLSSVCRPHNQLSSSSFFSESFGFDRFKTILFNIPFSALQVVAVLGSGFAAQKIKRKFPVIFVLTLPPIAGAVALLKLGRTPDLRHELLGCYYVVRGLLFTGPINR